MYFDAVVSDDLQEVFFNGTPEDTAEWLRKNPSTEKRWVSLGRSLRMLTPEEYLKEEN